MAEADTREGGEDGTPEPLPGAGTEEGARLAEAHAAFDRGDYRRVRALCDRLRGAHQDDVARAAGALRRRTEVDPVQIGVVLACLVLLGWLAYVYVP